MDDPQRKKICKDCGADWYFSEQWEALLRSTFGDGYNEPKRCQECLTAKKASKKDKYGEDNGPK